MLKVDMRERFGAAFCLTVAAGLLLGVAEYRTQPYLQNVKTDGITVMFELDGAAEAVVEYGATDGYGESAGTTVLDSGHGTYIHTGVLEGLKAGTEYHYRVVLDGTAATGDRVFTTGPEAAKPFSFGVWSDSQGHNHGAYADDPYEPTKRMMAHLAGSGVDFAVGVGDLAEDGNSYGDTRNYFLDRVAKYLGQTVPYAVAWGNHDKGRSAVLRKFADLPSKDRPGFDPGWGSFSFDYGGCHFICIDYDTMGSDIASWLEGDLQSAANQQARFTFLFVHVPPFCELWIDGSSALRATLVPLAEQYGVDAVFSGHTHEYERGYLNGVHYVITGGGSWLDVGEPVVKDWPHMFIGGAQDLPGYDHGLVNEYVRVDVSGDTWQATMHAFNPDGSYIGVLDTVSAEPVDSDGDGLFDDQEGVLGTNPDSADTDQDGLGDGDEVTRFGTDPTAMDSDGDGLSDAAELAYDGTAGEYAPGSDTDPMAADTDGDGVADGDEVSAGRDPLTPEGCALWEGFEGLTDALAPARDESLGADVLGWTHTPPPGWSIDNSRMPAQGVTEWQGWSFTTMAFWETAAGGQDRGGFTTARGVFAVADPDEWDDRNTPSNEGFFDSTLVSPRVPVPAGHRMVLRFDNDYRHEDAQTAEVLYCYDGGPDRLLARYDASSGDVRNQQVALEIPAPDAASELVVKWRMYRAGNDWWWAIDNVVLCDPAAQAEQVDSDGDGLSDAEEARLHTDPHNADTDHDGLLDGEETGRHGTDPLAFDTDGDTVGDGEEIRIGTSPLDRDDFIRTPLGGAGALAALGAAGVAEACRRHPRGGRGSRAVE